ncbi:stimulated by retinoic acid gene 6 protein-like [Pocillopora verrucosa]|uniref:stimulated by retinoic acid gene 6 protein-like n=1 Tax=Pocillopora verrucosa TaxID=203993 RepID=UPI00333FF938
MASHATSENDCVKAVSQLRQFHFGCLAPALVIIFVLSFLKRRTKLKLELWDGRPGLLIPMNFLGGLRNRWTIAVTFGATGSTVMTMAIIGKGGISIVPSESPWVKIIDVLLAVLLCTILFYPYFVCLTTEYKFVGSILGFLYGVLRFSFQLATQIRCHVAYKKTGYYGIIFLISNLPTTLCLIFITARFAFLIVRRVRQMWSVSSTESAGKDSCSRSLAHDADVVHVKFILGQKLPMILVLLLSWFEGKLWDALRRFDLSFLIYIFLILILGCLYGSYIFAALIYVITTLHFMKCHRNHMLQLYRGDRRLMQNVCLSPASFVGRSLSYTGYQIAYSVIGFVVLSNLGFLLSLILSVPIHFKIIRDSILSIAKGLVPSIVLAVILGVFQRMFLSRYIFRDREYPNFSVVIDNRRLFSIMSYAFVFLNAIVGFLSGLLRIAKAMILGLFFFSRLDRTVLMPGFQSWDKGFVAYLGFLHVLVAHRHPVVLMFCQLLIESNKATASEEKRHSSISVQPNNAEEPKQVTGFKREIRHPRLSQRVVNRWLLAVTLLRNPTIIQYRHHSFSVPIEQSEVDTSSVSVLVDSMV